MNKTAVMIGGTFAPITNAHLELGIQAKKEYPDADIIYIPSNLNFISDWKTVSNNELFGDKYRLQLIRDAIFPYGFLLSDIEAAGVVDGTTYESVRYLKSNGYENVIVCIGYDKIEEVSRWSHAKELCDMVEFLVFSRDHMKKKELEQTYHVIHPGSEFQAISSTKVREAYDKKDFGTIAKMVPKNVLDFLMDHAAHERS